MNDFCEMNDMEMKHITGSSSGGGGGGTHSCSCMMDDGASPPNWCMVGTADGATGCADLCRNWNGKC